MSTHLSALLRRWYPQREQAHWVLGTVYRTEGPAYRKAGAMMLFSDDGQQLGMLSGGCLESDIHRHARRVVQSGQAATLTYDGSDEDDLAFQLGIGCGGTVYILLQPLSAANGYLGLVQMHQALDARRGGYLEQLVADDGAVSARFLADDAAAQALAAERRSDLGPGLYRDGDQQWLRSRIEPAPHLLVVGGGVDARPLAGLAHGLGWQVSVWDPRPANARAEYFPTADRLLRGAAEGLARYAREQRVTAAVLMSHNIGLDAEALRALSDSRLAYWALLGPGNRRRQVLERAGLLEAGLQPVLAGPAGLDIGAELPETIALSILAECQAVLRGRTARSLSGVLAP